MTLPVIYVQKSGVDRLAKQLEEKDGARLARVEASSIERKGFEMYRKVETCKTCMYFEELDNSSACNYSDYREVEKDGSGFCNHHEVIW